ncbi:hypothetical protein HB364_25210 [Pseudoflavitalea sp. X16]|uniref:fibronectin type III domain-containing protein n=1 Tax=Paraflavitalea devenefica TaxID=2716334 RepID=UPI00141F9254|nr:fibronectin type III domain-containing protein [Paraflavitalea devenefica]NII28406.1 hypothetical protein [Paraflavitalea devenefica]
MNLNHLIRRKINRLTAKWLAVVTICMAGMLAQLPAAAQTIHPVTASLQLVPPYSVYLADYAAPGNDKLRVILTLNDLSQASYTIRLRIKVELNGRTIMQTDPAWRPSGITLLPGMPQVIAGAQLQDYLVTNHLQFLDGFSKDNYERTKALPEGAYRICIMAYDYYRNDNVAVSNEGCNIFFFQKKEPPVLNTPLCNTRVDRKDPQFLTFNWSMRNTPSPFAGASGTGYRFELFEVRPAGSNPEYIVRSSKPVYTATTDGLMLVYGPGEPRLMDSMQYVWRVQAFDKDGRDAYQNNGYSPACVFTYGGVDPFMAANIGRPELFGESLGERSGKWWWHISNGKTVDGWNIQYRKQAATSNKNDAHEWNKQYVTDSLLHLFNLESENTYEAQVQPVIRGITGSWSETAVFKTLPKRVYECGKNDTAAFGLGQAGAGQPLNSAVAGMVIRVGDFDMQLLQVSGGNGRFTGYGAVATPLLGLRLNVKFADAVINDRLQLTQGEVIALSDGIDAWIKDRTQVGRDVDVIKGWTEKMPDFETASLPVLIDFARELLGISDDIWKDTYVFTEAERKDVQDALAEVKAAMKDLEDGNPDNDAAAEKKLRTTLKKARPLLEKLSNNIGKGVLVRLGLTRKKLYKAVVSNYIKEIKALSGNVFNRPATSDMAMHGPAYEEDHWMFMAGLPACIKALDKSRQEQLAGYLQQKISVDTEWDKYVETLQEKIAGKQADEQFFDKVEKDIDAAGKNKADLTVESWSQDNGNSWNETNERFCTYVLEEFDAAQQEMQLLNSLVVDFSTNLSELSKDEGEYILNYGAKVRLKKGLQYTDGKVKVDGKTYVPIHGAQEHDFKGFYEETILRGIEKTPGKDSYNIDTLNKRMAWLDQSYYEKISELSRVYAREFFNNAIRNQALNRSKALEIAAWLDKINESVYDQYLKLAWADRSEQEIGLYEMGFSLGSWQDFEAAIKEFILIVNNKNAALSAAAKQWYGATTLEYKDPIREKIIKKILWQFKDQDYLNLSITLRDSVLFILNAGNLHSWNLGDKIAMQLVIKVDSLQQKAWMELLTKGNRLRELFSHVDGDEFSEMILGLSTMVVKHFKRPANFLPEDAILKGRYLPFKEGLFTGYVLSKWIDANGYISLSTRPQISFDQKDAEGIKATEWVYIDFKSSFKLNDNLTFRKGGRQAMPALLAYALFNEEQNRRRWDAAKFTLDVALLFTGVGEINAAIQAGTKLERAIRITKAVADIGLGLGDIVVNDVLATKLNGTKEGKEFLDTWNTIQLYYGLGSVTTEIGLYARKLYKQGKLLKDMNNGMAFSDELKEELDDVMDGVKKETGVADDATTTTTTPAKVVPAWETYLRSLGYSMFEEIDGNVFFRDGMGRLGRVTDKTQPAQIDWFTQLSGGSWQVHQQNASAYLRFKYGNNVFQQLKVKIHHVNGSSVDCYLDDVVLTNNGSYIISDAKHSQQAQIVDGVSVPQYTKNQTDGYQWIIDGSAARIEVIGYKGGVVIPKGVDLLPALENKILILTNDSNGILTELSTFRTR